LPSKINRFAVSQNLLIYAESCNLTGRRKFERIFFTKNSKMLRKLKTYEQRKIQENLQRKWRKI